MRPRSRTASTMPAGTNDGPSVALSFANNFWGKDDAGVTPLLERMHAAKQTCDELRSFYSARASIEEEYARKLLSLSRKSLGVQEMGTLKSCLDVVRGEVESMGKQHQAIAAQMKSDLEEPLAAFTGGMKERRKIVQNTVEKLLKIKVQQTLHVNKTRDKFEQECLKIKGYLAQGHMVMGQEERKNKAKLEKTQISVATSNSEYEAAIKVLEETTMRWNREWKAAADKFQDLEEERLDFTKSSLWTFANIASTVCVSDDASCEKIRLTLEGMEVEKDIVHFIKECGTGQEIPDPPKYVNFCRGDIETQSEASSPEDDAYSVAQFPRSINPAFRTSSPQPSTFESHHDPNSTLARDLGHGESVAPALAEFVPPVPAATSSSREKIVTPQKAPVVKKPPQQVHQVHEPPSQQRQQRESPQPLAPHDMSSMRGPAPTLEMAPPRPSPDMARQGQPYESQHSRRRAQTLPRGYQPPRANNIDYDPAEFGPVPHDPYPMDGMTMLCRPTGSELSTAPSSSVRPSSRDSHSETSFSSVEPGASPVRLKQEPPAPVTAAEPTGGGRGAVKKKGGFFNNHSPFRRKSTKEMRPPSGRNTWHPVSNQTRKPLFGRESQSVPQPGQSPQALMVANRDERTHSPDPIDADASLALNVGQNVFAVETPDRRPKPKQATPLDDDPIALALAELKGVTAGVTAGVGKQASQRMSADHYHGIATPAPGSTTSNSRSVLVAGEASSSGVVVPGVAGVAGLRGTPPPSYDQQHVQRLGVPPPAVTSRAMKESSSKFQQQTRTMFKTATEQPGSSYASSRSGTRAKDVPRAASPAAPRRSSSPRTGTRADPQFSGDRVSPSPYAGGHHRRGGSVAQAQTSRRGSEQGQGAYFWGTAASSRQNSPGMASPSMHQGSPRMGSPSVRRDPSPAPYAGGRGDYGSSSGSAARPGSSIGTNAGGGRSGSSIGMTGRPGSSMSGMPPPPSSPYAGRGEFGGSAGSLGYRPGSSMDDYGGSMRARPGTSSSHRGMNTGAMGLYEGAGPVTRQPSKSAADPSRFTRDGRPILHYARAMYMYQAAIPEELGFAKGDALAVLRHQDDGWWEATVQGGNGQVGLVPSNYLQPI